MSEWATVIPAVNQDGTVTLEFEDFLRMLAVRPVGYTTAQIQDAGNDVNTKDKWIGKPIYDTDTNKPYWATGTTTTSTWNDATGGGALTPS